MMAALAQATIAWQRGAVSEARRNGAFLLEVLEACRHQLAYCEAQSSFACVENEEALLAIDRAMDYLQARRDRRKAEGILGTHQPETERPAD